MSNTSWKQLEREVGLLVGGKRYPANQGGKVDVEGPLYVVQVKERKTLSLESLTQLVEEIEQLGLQRNKVGLVAVKVRRGRGKRSPLLIVQTAEHWALDNPGRHARPNRVIKTLPLAIHPLEDGVPPLKSIHVEPDWVTMDKSWIDPERK
jgi:hypothetical protein